MLTTHPRIANSERLLAMKNGHIAPVCRSNLKNGKPQTTKQIYYRERQNLIQNKLTAASTDPIKFSVEIERAMEVDTEAAFSVTPRPYLEQALMIDLFVEFRRLLSAQGT